MNTKVLFRFSALFFVLGLLMSVASVSLILGKHTLLRPFRGAAISQEVAWKNLTSSYLTTSKAYAASKEDFSVQIKSLVVRGEEKYFASSKPIDISCLFEVTFKKFRNFDVAIKSNQETILRETVKNQKQTEVKTSFTPATSGTYALSCEAEKTNLKKLIYVSE